MTAATWTFFILWILAMGGNIFAFVIKPAMRKRSRKAFNEFYHREDSHVEEVYTDEEGNKWYAYLDPIMMSGYRATAAEISQRQADLCMTPEDYARMVAKAKKHANTGDFTKAFAQLDVIADQMNQAGEETTLLNLANAYFLIEGEDPEVISQAATKRKQAIWEKDEKCRAFFLTASFRLTTKYGNISDDDILRYLMEKRLARQKATSEMKRGFTTTS